MKPNETVHLHYLPVHRLRTIARASQEHPGLTKTQISHITGLTYSQVRHALPSLEAHGILLSEDQQSRLYPFRPCNPDELPDD